VWAASRELALHGVVRQPAAAYLAPPRRIDGAENSAVAFFCAARPPACNLSHCTCTTSALLPACLPCLPAWLPSKQQSRPQPNPRFDIVSCSASRDCSLPASSPSAPNTTRNNSHLDSALLSTLFLLSTQSELGSENALYSPPTNLASSSRTASRSA
jgi:hypothetical protein